MKTDPSLTPADLAKPAARVGELAAQKVKLIDDTWDPTRGTPVFTVDGKYTTRGWTEWTQGFQYGCALLAFDLTREADLLKLGRNGTVRSMATHVTHAGVHDHGFNNLSTYGNLRRLMRENRISENAWEMNFYELALKASGAVQANRWSGGRAAQRSPRSANTETHGYVYSFNGHHSLFIDTMRTLRILGVAWQLGHVLMYEGDRCADLLRRSVTHGLTTAQFNLFYGDSGHIYDVRGRTAHEAIFNYPGDFRCRSTQQGYSPFSTWTRGLAWAILGYAEELEFLASIDAKRFERSVELPKADVIAVYEEAARATSDHYINDVTAADGIPYWDDGAPGLRELGDWRGRDAEPFNDHEPVDSSAAAIAAQGLLRLGRYLGSGRGDRYFQAGLTVARRLFSDDYLATSPEHQGLPLHSVYHRPNGWDHVPPGQKVPCGESSMWGDYHALELAVYLHRLASGGPYLAFFDRQHDANAVVPSPGTPGGG